MSVIDASQPAISPLGVYSLYSVHGKRLPSTINWDTFRQNQLYRLVSEVGFRLIA